jgi:hypothetical protein
MLLKDTEKEDEELEQKSMIASLAARLLLRQGRKNPLSGLSTKLFTNQLKTSYPTQNKLKFIKKIFQAEGGGNSLLRGSNA